MELELELELEHGTLDSGIGTSELPVHTVCTADPETAVTKVVVMATDWAWAVTMVTDVTADVTVLSGNSDLILVATQVVVGAVAVVAVQAPVCEECDDDEEEEEEATQDLKFSILGRLALLLVPLGTVLTVSCLMRVLTGAVTELHVVVVVGITVVEGLQTVDVVTEGTLVALLEAGGTGTGLGMGAGFAKCSLPATCACLLVARCI